MARKNFAKGELVMTPDYRAPFAASKLDRRTFLKTAALATAGGALFRLEPPMRMTSFRSGFNTVG
jgi:hypothetical protein